MQQYIITGGTTAKRAHLIAERYSVAEHQYIHIVPEGTSIKIKDIQDLHESTTTIATIPRLIWIEEADHMTIPAQNAILKILEEPPTNTTIVLTLNNSDSLLPTVRSRCQLERLSNIQSSPDLENLAIVKTALVQNEGERILTANTLGKDRTEALLWLQSLIESLHTVIGKTVVPKQLSLLGNISKCALLAHRQLSSNVSVGLSLQHFFLTLPKVK